MFLSMSNDGTTKASTKPGASVLSVDLEKFSATFRVLLETQGADAAVACVVAQLAAAQDELRQQIALHSMSKRGQARSGTERLSEQLRLLFNPTTPSESESVDDDPAADPDSDADSSDGPGEPPALTVADFESLSKEFGVPASMLFEQHGRHREVMRRLDEAKKAHAARERERRRLEAEERRRQEDDGSSNGFTGRNRTILNDPKLPHIQVPYEPGDDERICPCCHEQRTVIRTEEQRTLEMIPATPYVAIRSVPVFACKTCRVGVSTPPVLPLLIPKSMAGHGAIAHFVVDKFCDVTPVHRQVNAFGRAGVDLAESTVGTWVTKAIQKLHDVFSAALEKLVTAASTLRIDPTTFRILDPKSEKGSRRGTVSGFIVDRSVAVLRFTESGSPEDWLWPLLKGFNGKVLHDGSNFFDRLFNGRVGLALSFGCNAHSRRPFVPLADVDKRAVHVLNLYAGIWGAERIAKLENLEGAALVALRDEMARPIFNDLLGVLTPALESAPPSEPFPKAARYFTKRFAALTRYLDHADMGPDNNASEALLRILRLLEHNSLFAASVESAKAHSTTLALMATCSFHGVNPWLWLRHVFDRIADGLTAADEKDVRSLIPDRWKIDHLPSLPEADLRNLFQALRWKPPKALPA